MKTITTGNTENEKAAMYLLEQAMGYTYQASLRAVALLGVADHLKAGPQHIETLSKKLNVDAQNLHRVMRLLATRDIFSELEPGQFALTPAAECLCVSAKHPLRDAVLMLTDETFWRPLGELVENLRGHSSFKQIYDMSFFEYWSKDHSKNYDFHSGMSSMSEVENIFLVRSYDFPEGATVVDIAGGMGGLLLQVLQANPTLHGILFDQQHVLTRHRLGELGDNSRWRLQPGSFFESCPPADVYLLKYIMHDWPDEKASIILNNCRKAMHPGGKVLVMDPVPPEGNIQHFGKEMDILLLSSFDGGRERTERELKQLFASAGLKINRIMETGSLISIVEAIAI
ncbi:methyltransferase [Pectobacterium peruviense]|uniref:methyltransferase n=1 Tax=Pectobacterium peruviense TaxID=2066479 RepID=UPI000DE2FF4A|nr:methyltransferase [Pectobacterium peruviense]